MSEMIELVAEGKSHFVPLADAERELGIASGNTKEVTSDALAIEPENTSNPNRPVLVIRPHQTLIIKAVGGTLSCPGTVCGGAALRGEVVNAGTEAHYKPHWGRGMQQGEGNSWVVLTTPEGQHRRLAFSWILTKG